MSGPLECRFVRAVRTSRSHLLSIVSFRFETSKTAVITASSSSPSTSLRTLASAPPYCAWLPPPSGVCIRLGLLVGRREQLAEVVVALCVCDSIPSASASASVSGLGSVNFKQVAGDGAAGHVRVSLPSVSASIAASPSDSASSSPLRPRPH